MYNERVHHESIFQNVFCFIVNHYSKSGQIIIIFLHQPLKRQINIFLIIYLNSWSIFFMFF